jgi:hypothetical protein
MAVVVVNCAAAVDATATIPSSAWMVAAKMHLLPPPSTAASIYDNCYCAVDDRHCRCHTVDGQWWRQLLLMATATVGADMVEGGQERKGEDARAAAKTARAERARATARAAMLLQHLQPPFHWQRASAQDRHSY